MTQEQRQSGTSTARRRLFARPPFAVRLVGGIVTAFLLVAVVTVLLLSITNTAKFVPVLSDSMAPTMPIGSLALTVPLPRSDIRVGDVIVFIDPNHPTIRVIHRVEHIFRADEASRFTNWKANELTASTKGDNNPAADPWTVTIADPTVWRLAGSVSNLGFPAIWLLTPTFRVWVFGAASVALIAWMLVLVWWRPARSAA